MSDNPKSTFPTGRSPTPPTGCRTASMRPWPEGVRSGRGRAIMPRVDLTPRLARDAGPGAKDAFLFDKALPGFGLRIHPSGRKVWTVQARIEGRSRRIVIARHGEMELAQARRRARDMPARIRAGRASRQPRPAHACCRYLTNRLRDLGPAPATQGQSDVAELVALEVVALVAFESPPSNSPPSVVVLVAIHARR